MKNPDSCNTLLSPVLLPPTSGAQASTSSSAIGDFNGLADQYFDFYLRFILPTEQRRASINTMPSLEDYSRAAVDAETAGLKKLQTKLEQFPKAQLPEDTAADLDLLQNQIKARLLELQDIQMWRKNPDNYSSGVTESIFVIMKRNFAPPEDRLRFGHRARTADPQGFCGGPAQP